MTYNSAFHIQNLKAKLHDSLETNEKILWSGMPNPLRTGLKTSGIAIVGVPILILGLYLCLLSAQSLFEAITHKETTASFGYKFISAIFFSLLSLTVVFVGTLMALEPFKKYKSAFHTIHAITQKRIITLVAKDLNSNLIIHRITKNTTLKIDDYKDCTSTLYILCGTCLVIRADKNGGNRTIKVGQDWFGISDGKNAHNIIASLAKISKDETAELLV
jgi:hypothetical protein